VRDVKSDLSDLRSAERTDLVWALDAGRGPPDHRAMDVTSFHKLRTAVQENAAPAGSLEVLELETGLRAELEESGYFDQVEVGSTADPDQLVIALCRCAPEVPAWEASYRVEHVWDVLRAGSAWEAHAGIVTEELADFEGAMTSPDGRHFLTVHVVALRHAEDAGAEGGAQALGN
jgi:hypothetical protein